MTSERLHIDIETFSEADLKKVGMYAYAEHPSTEVLVLCFALSDGPVHIWVPVESLPQAVLDGIRKKMDPGAQLFVQPLCPDVLKRAVLSGAEIA